MYNKYFLKDLLMTHTPSGYENLFLQKPAETLFEYIHNDFGIDALKNIIFHKGSKSEDATPFMISAHYDEIALQVSAITKSGLLKVINLGGLDLKTIEGSYVEVIIDEMDEWGNPKTIKGIIGKKPIHKESKEDREKTDTYEKLIVDVGCNSKQEVSDLGIHIGCPIVFKKECQLEFGKDEKHIVGNALDDKIGIYVVSQAFLEIDEQLLIDKNIALYLVWCSQEEVGLRGAKTVTQAINPAISIDVDVCFDNSYYKSKDNDNEIKIGKGVVITYGPHCDWKLVKIIRDAANKYALSYQEEVTKVGGNNCDAIQLHTSNCSTAHLGIPCRNMHTQVEMCHWDDVESCIDLIKILISDN